MSDLLDAKLLVSALETAFRDRYSQVVLPERVHLNTAHGVFLNMSCYDRETDSLGMKLISVAKHSLPAVTATYLLLDSRTGRILFTLPANRLTQIRTAATSALASRYLARKDSAVLGVFGTGLQARAHIELFSSMWQFSEILICGHTRQKAQALVDDYCTRLNVQAADPESCAARADVICACTNATAPLFSGKLLRPGTHLILVGSYRPTDREVDSLAVSRARVYVDTYRGALAEAGDILIPMQEGLITREHVVAELHELVSGSSPARRSAEEITIFKSVGCALEDLVAAELIEQKFRSMLDPRA